MACCYCMRCAWCGNSLTCPECGSRTIFDESPEFYHMVNRSKRREQRLNNQRTNLDGGATTDPSASEIGVSPGID